MQVGVLLEFENYNLFKLEWRGLIPFPDFQMVMGFYVSLALCIIYSIKRGGQM